MQTEIVPKLLELHNFALKAPTASGKTYLQDMIALTAEQTALIVLPTRALLGERAAGLDALKPQLIHGSSGTNFDDLRAKIVLATAEKAEELLKRRHHFCKYISVVIIDEVHFAAQRQRTYAVIIQLCSYLGIRVCAFSATLPRGLAVTYGLEFVQYRCSDHNISFQCQ